MEWLCNCVRRIGESSFVLNRKINTEVSSRKMKPCRWSCLWSQEKLAERLELRISPQSIGGPWHWAAECVGVSMGPSTEVSLWSSKPFAEQFIVWGCSSSKHPDSLQVKAKNLLCDSQLGYAGEVVEKIFQENSILNNGGWWQRTPFSPRSWPEVTTPCSTCPTCAAILCPKVVLFFIFLF